LKYANIVRVANLGLYLDTDNSVISVREDYIRSVAGGKGKLDLDCPEPNLSNSCRRVCGHELFQLAVFLGLSSSLTSSTASRNLLTAQDQWPGTPESL